MNKHIGSRLDQFLEEEDLLAETEAVAIKRVIAWQIERLMTEEGLTKSEMARRMGTSWPPWSDCSIRPTLRKRC